MFGLFSCEREPGTHSTPRDEASDATARTCPHRHRWSLPNCFWGSRYVVMLVDSASRLQRSYGAREKSVTTIDVGVPRAFRTDNSIEYSNSMFMDFAMASGFVASLRQRIRHSRIDPSRTRYRELLRLDTGHDLKFRSCTQTYAWKRSGVAPTLQERAFGWSHYSGHWSASTGRQHQ